MNEQVLVSHITQIIEEGDLNDLTVKKIFKQLKEKFGGLEEHKKFIRKTVSSILEQKANEENDVANDDNEEDKVDEPTEEVQAENGESKEEGAAAEATEGTEEPFNMEGSRYSFKF